MEVITGKTREIMQVAYDIIYYEVKKLTDATDPFNPDEQAFYSADYGKITHRQILNICKNPFRGEPGRIDNTKVKVKALTFDKEIINRVGKIFEAITEIKILQPEDEAEDDIDTLATEQRNFSTCTEKEENKESIQSEQLSQNIHENNNNHINEVQTIEESQDNPRNNMNDIAVQNASDGIDITNNKNDVYTTIASNSVVPLPGQKEEPKPYSGFLVNGVPIWQLEKRGMTKEEDEAFRAEVERLNKYNSYHNDE